MTEIETYRIGWFTHKWWPSRALIVGLIFGRDPYQRATSRAFYVKTILGRLAMIRRPHQPWQAEASGLRFARRGFTSDHARRKVGRDLTWEVLLETPSPYQRRRLLRTNRKAA